jgi:hypothetical protein
VPVKLVWTDARDSRLLRLRQEGVSWDGIAGTLSVSRCAVIERGRRIGARLPPAERMIRPEDPAREPLPAGHPRSWDVLTAGSILAGTPYPLPVYER